MRALRSTSHSATTPSRMRTRTWLISAEPNSGTARQASSSAELTAASTPSVDLPLSSRVATCEARSVLSVDIVLEK